MVANPTLAGVRVVVTRAHGAAGGFCADLRALGAEVREMAVIKSTAPDDPEPARRAIREWERYDWVVFTSPQGVEVFMRQWTAECPPSARSRKTRVAVVGSSTAKRVQGSGWRVDAMPADFVGEHVARAMAQRADLKGSRILLARAQEANHALVRELQSQGAQVDDVAFYRTVPETEDRNGEGVRLWEQGAEWITFTSGSTVRNFAARIDLQALTRRFPSLRLASIGPETSKSIRELDLVPAVEAEPHTLKGLVAAIAQYAENERRAGKTKD